MNRGGAGPLPSRTSGKPLCHLLTGRPLGSARSTKGLGKGPCAPAGQPSRAVQPETRDSAVSVTSGSAKKLTPVTHRSRPGAGTHCSWWVFIQPLPPQADSQAHLCTSVLCPLPWDPDTRLTTDQGRMGLPCLPET